MTMPFFLILAILWFLQYVSTLRDLLCICAVLTTTLWKGCSFFISICTRGQFLQVLKKLFLVTTRSSANRNSKKEKTVETV